MAHYTAQASIRNLLANPQQWANLQQQLGLRATLTDGGTTVWAGRGVEVYLPDYFNDNGWAKGCGIAGTKKGVARLISTVQALGLGFDYINQEANTMVGHPREEV